MGLFTDPLPGKHRIVLPSYYFVMHAERHAGTNIRSQRPSAQTGPGVKREIDRSKLRYRATRRTKEWAIIDRLIPRAKPGGNKRIVDVRAVVNGGCICSPPAANGRRCRKTCRRGATAHDYLHRWDDDWTLDRFSHGVHVLPCDGGYARKRHDTRWKR